MSAQPKPSEPSMEEILASIRRIIADDEVKPAAAPEPEPAPIALVAEPAAEPETPPEIEDDVLDLGAEASRLEPVAAQANDDIDFAEPVVVPPPVSEMPPPPEAVAPVVAPFVAVQVPPQVPPQASPQPSFDMASLLSDQAGAAVNNAFGALAHTVLNNNARTLEDLVKDMLKPMLKTWLDDNLPGMVERLVRAEIERVARGGRH